MSESAGSIGILVVTHGRLAEELVEATRVILGGPERPLLRALSIGWDDPVDEARELVGRALEELDTGAGVLVLTDMFGGTPTNLCLSFLSPNHVEIVTGVNLPMVVKTANLTLEPHDRLALRSTAERVAARGAESVIVASRMLEPESDAGEPPDAAPPDAGPPGADPGRRG